LCYANGEGVAKDQVKAVEWYRKAAEQGDKAAQAAIEPKTEISWPFVAFVVSILLSLFAKKILGSIGSRYYATILRILKKYCRMFAIICFVACPILTILAFLVPNRFFGVYSLGSLIIGAVGLAIAGEIAKREKTPM